MCQNLYHFKHDIIRKKYKHDTHTRIIRSTLHASQILLTTRPKIYWLLYFRFSFSQFFLHKKGNNLGIKLWDLQVLFYFIIF